LTVIIYVCRRFNPDLPGPPVYMPSLETAARSFKVEPIMAPVHSDADIETAIIALGREPGGGLVGDAFNALHRAPISTYDDPGPIVFEHACKLGCECIESKRRGSL